MKRKTKTHAKNTRAINPFTFPLSLLGSFVIISAAIFARYIMMVLSTVETGKIFPAMPCKTWIGFTLGANFPSRGLAA
jgi:hypothetical protein